LPPAAHRPARAPRSAEQSDGGPQLFAPPHRMKDSRDRPASSAPAIPGSQRRLLRIGPSTCSCPRAAGGAGPVTGRIVARDGTPLVHREPMFRFQCEAGLVYLARSKAPTAHQIRRIRLKPSIRQAVSIIITPTSRRASAPIQDPARSVPSRGVVFASLGEDRTCWPTFSDRGAPQSWYPLRKKGPKSARLSNTRRRNPRRAGSRCPSSHRRYSALQR
jgi:hypothetical protein